VVTPPAAIPHNCSSDAAPALRSWLWSLPKGTVASPLVIDFPVGACYVVNEALYLRGMTYTTFDGRGSTFRQVAPVTEVLGPFPVDHPYCGSSVDYQSGDYFSAVPIVWWFEGGCLLTVENMTIIGPNTAGVVGTRNDSGIQLSGVEGALIQKVNIKDVDGDFVTLSGLHEAGGQRNDGQANYPTTYTTITANSFSRSGRQGITPEYVTGVSITGNSFSGVAASTIDLEADVVGGCACNVHVDHNTFVGPVTYLVAGITGLSIEHFSFDNNVLIGGAELKIQLAPQLPSSDIDISHNWGTAASGWPWPSIGIAYSVAGNSVGLVTGVTVTQNSFPAPKQGEPFVLAGSQTAQVLVGNNTITGGSASIALVNYGLSSNRACGNTAAAGGTSFDGIC
jgi:hypothetical protein